MKRIPVYIVFGFVMLIVGIGLGFGAGSRGSTFASTVTDVVTSTVYNNFTDTSYSTLTNNITSVLTSTSTATVTTTSVSLSTMTFTETLSVTDTVTSTNVVTGYTTVTDTATVTMKPSYMVEFLGDDEYFDSVLGLLDKAEDYVYVAMYIMKYDVNEDTDPVNLLLYKLVDLHDRGVDVRVIVDDYTRSHYNETISYLKENGISVRLDPRSGTTLHAKIVIIDGKWVVVGSHNWSESGLKYNYEAAILTDKNETVSEAEEYFNSLWENGREQ